MRRAWRSSTPSSLPLALQISRAYGRRAGTLALSHSLSVASIAGRTSWPRHLGASLSVCRRPSATRRPNDGGLRASAPTPPPFCMALAIERRKKAHPLQRCAAAASRISDQVGRLQRTLSPPVQIWNWSLSTRAFQLPRLCTRGRPRQSLWVSHRDSIACSSWGRKSFSAFSSIVCSRKGHVAALISVAIAVILLMTPAALHRIAFKGEDTERFLRTGSWFVVSAPVPLAAGIAADLYVATSQASDSAFLGTILAVGIFVILAVLWYGLPLYLRKHQANERFG
jgi:hypothetical protein